MCVNCKEIHATTPNFVRLSTAEAVTDRAALHRADRADFLVSVFLVFFLQILVQKSTNNTH